MKCVQEDFFVMFSIIPTIDVLTSNFALRTNTHKGNEIIGIAFSFEVKTNKLQKKPDRLISFRQFSACDAAVAALLLILWPHARIVHASAPILSAFLVYTFNNDSLEMFVL